MIKIRTFTYTNSLINHDNDINEFLASSEVTEFIDLKTNVGNDFITYTVVYYHESEEETQFHYNNREIREERREPNLNESCLESRVDQLNL